MPGGEGGLYGLRARMESGERRRRSRGVRTKSPVFPARPSRGRASPIRPRVTRAEPPAPICAGGGVSPPPFSKTAKGPLHKKTRAPTVRAPNCPSSPQALTLGQSLGRRGSRGPSPGPRFQPEVPGLRSKVSRSQVSRSQVPRSQVPGPRSQVPRSQVPGPRSQVPGPRFPGPRFQVPGPRSQVPGPRSQIQCPRSQVSRSQVPESQRLWARVPGPR